MPTLIDQIATGNAQIFMTSEKTRNYINCMKCMNNQTYTYRHKNMTKSTTNWFGCHLWFNPATTSLLRWRLSSKNYWQTLKANFLNKEICNLKNIIKCSYPNKHFFSNNFNLRTERTRIMKSLVWLFSLSISVSKESPRFALQFI